MKSLAFALSFLGGFTDTIGFILFSGIFTAHVTGNFVLLGSALVTGNTSEVWVMLLVTTIFFIACMIAYCVLQVDKEPKIKTKRWFFAFEALLLLLFMVMGLSISGHHTNLNVLAISTPAVAAMALKNTHTKGLLKGIPGTTFVTNDLTQIAMDLSGILRNGKQTDPNKMRASQICAISGFILGVVTSTFLIRFFGYYCVLLPVTILIGLIIQAKSFDKLVF